LGQCAIFLLIISPIRKEVKPSKLKIWLTLNPKIWGHRFVKVAATTKKKKPSSFAQATGLFCFVFEIFSHRNVKRAC
jgi:hypothetical protein